MASPVNAGPLFFITLANSPLQSVSDLVGRRIAVGLEDSGMFQHVLTIFDVLGISFDDFTPIYLSFADGAEALEEGEVDAQFQCPVPNQVMTDLCQRAKIRILDHTPEHLNRLIAAVPYYRPVVISAGTLRGLHTDTAQVGVLNVLVPHERVTNDMVTKIVSAMASGASELARLNPLYIGLEALYAPLRTIGRQAYEFGGVQMHSGAVQAYRDVGLFN